MANSKKRCRSCKSYKLTKEMKQAPNGGFFCNTQCMTTYAYKNKEKGKQIKYRAQKKEYNDNKLSTRKRADTATIKKLVAKTVKNSWKREPRQKALRAELKRKTRK